MFPRSISSFDCVLPDTHNLQMEMQQQAWSMVLGEREKEGVFEANVRMWQGDQLQVCTCDILEETEGLLLWLWSGFLYL